MEALLPDPREGVLMNGGSTSLHTPVSEQPHHLPLTADNRVAMPSGRDRSSNICHPNSNNNNNNNNNSRKRPHAGGQELEGDQPRDSLRRHHKQHRPRQPKRLHQHVLDFGSIRRPTLDDAIPPDQVYGDGVEPKPDGTFQLAYGNIDGFNTVSFNNLKGNILRHWLWLVEADFFAGNEAKVNWSLMPRSGRLAEIFRTENALRTVASYNIHEQFGRRQYGGTFQLTFGALASRVVDTGVDARQLGRYSWTKFQGRNGHVAWIITLYVPCKATHSSGDLTVMNQHRRYFEAQGIMRCPRELLLEDIRTDLLQAWRAAGEQLIVFVDANENVINGPFHDMFVSPALQLREAVMHRHPDPRWQHTATYSKGDSRGKWPIDGVYVTPDLSFDAASRLQFMPHLGDHRFAVLDIKSDALVGDSLLKIVRPVA